MRKKNTNVFKIIFSHLPFTVGLLLITCGILIFYFLVSVFSLHCYRSQPGKGVCTYQAQTLSKNKERIFKLSEFKQISVQKNEDLTNVSQNKNNLYLVKIETTRDTISFAPDIKSDLKTKQQIVNKVNVFFNNSAQKEVFIEQNNRKYSQTIGVILFVSGIIFVIISFINMFIINLIFQRKRF